MFAACHELARLQAIDRGRHGSAREFDAPAEFVERLRPLMEERFENREIRQTHVERLDAALRVALQRAVGFHEHQPHMDAGLFSCSCHSPVPSLCRNQLSDVSLDKMYLIIKSFDVKVCS